MNAPVDDIPQIHVPSTSRAEHLISCVRDITTFAEVAAWDREARQLAGQFRAFIARVPHLEEQVSRVEAAARAAHAQKPFLRRLFSTPPLTAEISRTRGMLRSSTRRLDRLADQLETLIDETPDNPAEKKQLLAELRGLKKELNLEKKELAAEMRQVRAQARRANANVGGIFSTPKSRRYDRISIRLKKEEALRPHEGRRVAIDREILEIDRMIMWIERIK